MKKEEFKKYIFKKYDPKSIGFFQSEKRKLRKIFGKDVDIEHIGSTAVKGLGGKGIIDILIGVSKKGFFKIKNKLLKYNYHQPVGGSKNRIFLEKNYKHSGKVRRVHLQIVPKNSEEWKDAIKARDNLRKSRELREEYIRIKKNAVKKAKGIGKVYRGSKNKFLQKISK